MADSVPLYTPRLVLTPATDADVPDLVGHYRDPDVRRFLWDGVEVDDAAVAEAVRAAGEARPGIGLWVIREREDGPLEGSCGTRTNGEEVELVVSLARQRWGRGWATEAARAVLDHATAHGVRQVMGYVDEGNDASARLLRRLGGTGGPHRWTLTS
ncbi:GNAT family N-acetyltransferase [Actinomycetospora straminea]|uniref:GNAT family N-acetyltransferase n=1 Tax=Actinomycetospora straminea TaxID=663607 RepID=UPI00236740BC|nr:GNAT family N-acetyltransferase [Actinomycetospora straminea]MDD7931592.1 GNAT family N-acetyltransferase [Actinomycetospora straminea]